MANSKEAVLMAGMIVALELDKAGAPGVYVSSDGITSFGAVGEIGESKDQTTLADSVMRHGAGMLDTPDQSIKGNQYPGNLIQEEFIKAAMAKKLIGVMVIYPSGVKAVFDLQLLGFQINEASSGGDWITFTVPSKQSGKVSWTLSSETPTPGDITFTPVTDAAVSTATTSESVTITGLSSATTIAVSGGTYTINGGDETSDVGIVKTGDAVTITLTSSPAKDTPKSAFINVGGVTGTFTVTTVAAT